MLSNAAAVAGAGMSVERDDTPLALATISRVSAHLLPFLFVLYVVNFIDRSNVALAALQMNRDLGFSGAVYSLGVGVFFLGYAPFEAPSNLILVRVGARRWMSRIMITWGAIATALMFVRTPLQFYTLRFLLGLAEAGFFPGILYYLGEWFPRAQRGRAVARFMLGLPVSGVIGGPLGGWLLGFNGHFGLHGWQWLFLIEGVPAVVLGIAVLFYLPDTVSEARWLSDDQRAWLSERLRFEREDDIAISAAHDPWKAFVNPTVWLLGFIYLLINTGAYAQTFWAPIVVRDATHASNVVVGWIVGGMAAASGISMLVAGASSDRQQERFLHAAFASALVSVGFAGTALLPSPWGPIVGFTIATVGTRAFHPAFWCIPTLMLRGAAASLAFGIIVGVGNLGGFIGPYAVGVLKDATGNTTGVFLGISAMALCAAVLILLASRQKAFAMSRRPGVVFGAVGRA